MKTQVAMFVAALMLVCGTAATYVDGVKDSSGGLSVGTADARYGDTWVPMRGAALGGSASVANFADRLNAVNDTVTYRLPLANICTGLTFRFHLAPQACPTAQYSRVYFQLWTANTNAGFVEAALYSTTNEFAHPLSASSVYTNVLIEWSVPLTNNNAVAAALYVKRVAPTNPASTGNQQMVEIYSPSYKNAR